MSTICQYSKLKSFKNLKINNVQISLCFQNHMKQCRREANGCYLLRGQWKSLPPSERKHLRTPLVTLQGYRVRCAPKCSSATAWTKYCTKSLRLCHLPESHQDSLFVSQLSLGELTNPSLFLSLPFILLQNMPFQTSVISLFPWDVCEPSEHILPSQGPFPLCCKPGTVSTPIHNHCTVSAAVLKPN